MLHKRLRKYNKIKIKFTISNVFLHANWKIKKFNIYMKLEIARLQN